MIGWAGRWTQTPFATPLQPKTWNTHFWIMFNIWWSARLVDGLEPHMPNLFSRNNEMLIFGLCSTSDDQPGCSMDSNPICHPSTATKMKCSFLDYIQLLMISHAGPWTQAPSATSLQPRKMKCSFLDYVQLLMISWTGQWTRMPSTTPLQPKTWNACFWITFNFWWSARLVDALEPHLPPLSSQKNEMLIFGLCSTSDDRPGWSMDSNPICHPSPAKNMICPFLDYVQLLMIGRAGQWTQTPSTTPLQPKKWNACFWITFTYWWSARLVDGLEPHLPPISSQKHEMLIFGLCSTSDDQMAWLMDSNPICNPSAARKTKCSFLDYVQFLMIGQAGWWTWTPSTTPLHLKKWNAHFWIMFNFWWSAMLVDVLKSLLPTLSSQKYEMLILKLCSTSDDWPGWLMDSNSICNCSAAKKMKCSFLDFVQLLMIGQAGQWTQTPSATPLQP